MKFTIDPIIFEQFPDFSAGLVAMKGIDNLVADRDIEAFLRHASLEAGLLLKLRPLASDHGVRVYRDALAKGGMDGVPAMERVIRELGEHIAAEQQAALAGENAARGPGSVTGLIGDTALPRINPVRDLARGAELQFRLPVFAFDMGDESEALILRRTEAGDRFLDADGAEQPLGGAELVFALGHEISVRRFFCDEGKLGAVVPETRNILMVIPCFAATRRKAMSVRNELARRMKDSFGRTAETAWLDRDTAEFVSEI